jgi:hypothetical protein
VANIVRDVIPFSLPTQSGPMKFLLIYSTFIPYIFLGFCWAVEPNANDSQRIPFAQTAGFTQLGTLPFFHNVRCQRRTGDKSHEKTVTRKRLTFSPRDITRVKNCKRVL